MQWNSGGVQSLHDVKSMIGSSSEVNELKALIRVIGPSDSTVLITGETGTGKELVAQALHKASPRAEHPFIPVNCGAIPRDLLESELFGHRKGAFTGAISDRRGRFELAHKGTILLDEIGDMSMDLQVKLLRVLQEQIIDPIGATQSKNIDVRVVAATHENLETLIEEAKFREDLFFRLNVLPVAIKPLRDHSEDIPQLFEYLAREHAREGCDPISLHQRSLELMFKYHWPGNIRELSNLVDRYTALYPQQQIDLTKVPQSMLPLGMRKLLNDDPEKFESFDKLQSLSKGFEELEYQKTIAIARGQLPFPPHGLQLKTCIINIERSIISQALQRTQGNVSQTAKLIGVRRTTLIEKISKHGLRENQSGAAEHKTSNGSEVLHPEVEDIITMAQGHLSPPEQGLQLGPYLRDIESNLIHRALELRDGNVSKAAELLGLKRTTLIEKMNK